jgi:hypothetical protein
MSGLEPHNGNNCRGRSDSGKEARAAASLTTKLGNCTISFALSICFGKLPHGIGCQGRSTAAVLLIVFFASTLCT